MNGINIVDIWDKSLMKKLSALPKDVKFTARIVVDNPVNWEQLRFAVNTVKDHAEIMIQIQDSFGERELTDAEYYKKADLLFKAFEKDCKLWEIGNEINGDWCSPQIAERVKTVWGMVPSDHKSLITLFYDPTLLTDLNWYKNNPLQVDYVMASFYPQNWNWLSDSWDPWIEAICKLNKNAKVGVSEWGFEEWIGRLSWRQKAAIRRQVESNHALNPNWVAGFFYWDGQSEGWR